jgi:hypothetical protein
VGVINNRLKFLAKYGKEEHRAKLSAHIDDLLDRPQDSYRDHNIVRSQIAADSDVPLTSGQVHKIIDTKNPPDLCMTHPMVPLVKHHVGDVKEEHWNKILKQGSDQDITGVMPHMHSDQLEHVFNDANRAPDVRNFARRQHKWAKMREDENDGS